MLHPKVALFTEIVICPTTQNRLRYSSSTFNMQQVEQLYNYNLQGLSQCHRSMCSGLTFIWTVVPINAGSDKNMLEENAPS